MSLLSFASHEYFLIVGIIKHCMKITMWENAKTNLSLLLFKHSIKNYVKKLHNFKQLEL